MSKLTKQGGDHLENVVIIDSGIGGLSVYNHLLELNCNIQVTYLADNRFFPYGTKDDNELKKILDRILTYFSNQNYKHLFLACNTASVIYSNYFLNQYPIHVYPIIENTVDEISALKTCRHVGVIGTKKTIESNVYQIRIKEQRDVTVTSLACSELVTLCEHYDKNLIKAYIQKHFNVFDTIDTIILGCTHFNVIADLIDEFFEHRVHIICSGYSLIESLNEQFLNQHSHGDNQIFITKKENNYQQVINNLFPKLKHIPLEHLNI